MSLQRFAKSSILRAAIQKISFAFMNIKKLITHHRTSASILIGQNGFKENTALAVEAVLTL
jgi:hypothetical protein